MGRTQRYRLGPSLCERELPEDECARMLKAAGLPGNEGGRTAVRCAGSLNPALWREIEHGLRCPEKQVNRR